MKEWEGKEVRGEGCCSVLSYFKVLLRCKTFENPFAAPTLSTLHPITNSPYRY